MNIDHQSASSVAQSFLRFCWLRETAPGHLEHDGDIRIPKSDLLLALFGIHPAQKRTITEPPVSMEDVLAKLSSGAPFDDLPLWSRRRLSNLLGPLAFEEQRRSAARNASVLIDVADRILAVIPVNAEVEVHLPYIDRRDWLRRFEILEKTEFVLHEGRVIPRALLSPGLLEEYDAQLLAISSVIPQVSVRQTFSHVQLVSATLLRSLLPIDADPIEMPPASGDATTIPVEIRFTLNPSACRAWNGAPVEKSGAYFPIHAAVSVAIQAALRRWLAWYWLSDLEHFAETPSAFTVLGYLCSRPYPGRRRTDFTYDTLTNEWMYTAFHCARRPLRLLLKSVRAALATAGKSDLAQTYHPSEAKTIIARVRKQRKAIQALVAAEGEIVNYILKFGLTLRGVTEPITVSRNAPEFIRGLANRLRRFFRQEDLAWMAPMLLLIATDALSVAMGGEPAIQTAVTCGQPAGIAALATPPVLAQVPQQLPIAPFGY